MKKIVLIIFIVLCIFQMVVLATAINIGSAAIDRASFAGSNKTMVDKNPANGTGKITTFKIWPFTDMTNVRVATFYVISGRTLATRDWEAIAGTITAGGERSYTVDLDVVEGDYLGFFSDGYIEHSDSGGVGYWQLMGNYIPTTNRLFDTYDNYIPSFGGTGATAEEEANAIFFGMPF